MKKALKFSVVFLCVAIFASLLIISVKQSGLGGSMPKAPIYASFTPIARSTDPTSITIELPEDHNADEVVLYFGDELGRFDETIGVFEVTENTVICKLSDQVVCPENATKIWVYTVNGEGMSDTGCAVDLSYPTSPLKLDDEPEEKGKDSSRYVAIAIGAALLLSFLGYAWLGKKPAEDEERIEEQARE